jgi:Tfp pilus assembly protein PilF
MNPRSIAGYEILGTIGEGGMGIVYRARDLTLDREIAIKVIRSATLVGNAAERFVREAQACSRINHPNIVTVYAAGRDGDVPYLAMELLRGENMRAVIERGPVPWERATGWIAGILDALARLHAEGIVHRDLKPENIIITEGGTAKLMDFGIARLGAGGTITVDGATLGTAHYMSPEQVEGKQVDARSDLFSVGSVLYELLAGEPAFAGEHPLAAMYAITHESPRPLAEIVPDLPSGLSNTVARAIEKNPDARFQSAAAFRDALLEIARGAAASVPAPAAPKASKRLLAGASLAALVAAAAIIFAVIGRERGPAGDRPAAERLNRLAQSLTDEGKIEEASREYRNAIIADPRWEAPWNNLAMIAMGSGKLAEADSLLEKAVSLNPRYTAALYNLGTVRWARGDSAGAEKAYREAIRTDSTFVEAFNNLGALLIERRRAAEAARILDTGLATERAHPSPAPEIRGFLLKNRGAAALKLGRREEALSYWREALEIIPRNAELQTLIREHE